MELFLKITPIRCQTLNRPSTQKVCPPPVEPIKWDFVTILDVVCDLQKKAGCNAILCCVNRCILPYRKRLHLRAVDGRHDFRL